MIHIELSPDVALKLMTIANLTVGKEFSGFGFIEQRDQTLYVYDAVVLDIGSEVWTEIASEKMFDLLQRPDAKNMRLWLHRHPLGDGVPGKQNWSGTDNATIRDTPLGGVPELVKWSASMVLTPKGWVGRIDNHLTKKTQHIEVVPQIREAYTIVEKIKSEKKKSATLGSVFSVPYMFDYQEQTINEFEEIARERFPQHLLRDLGITTEDVAEMLADSYYYGEEEFIDMFLDPATPTYVIKNLIQDRMEV